MMNLKLQDVKDLNDFEKIDTTSWEEVKDHIYLRLINTTYLDYYDPEIAHREILDLSFTLSVQEQVKKEFKSHMLTNSELKEYGVSFDEAFEIAKKNSENDKHRRIFTMREMSAYKDNPLAPLCRPIPQEAGMLGMQMGRNGQPSFIKDEEKGQANVLVSVNSKGPLGSSYALLDSTLKEVYKKFGKENFYICPMSINDTLFVSEKYVTNNGKKDLDYVEDDLLDMVETINNENNGSWKNVLSYKVYYYDGINSNLDIPILLTVKR